jgi:hypothetical protein
MNSRLLRSSVAGRDGWSSAARLRIGAVGTFFSAALCICDSGEGREGQHDGEECDYGFLEHRRNLLVAFTPLWCTHPLWCTRFPNFPNHIIVRCTINVRRTIRTYSPGNNARRPISSRFSGRIRHLDRPAARCNERLRPQEWPNADRVCLTWTAPREMDAVLCDSNGKRGALDFHEPLDVSRRRGECPVRVRSGNPQSSEHSESALPPKADVSADIA